MTTQQKLDEARSALHQLMLGKKAVRIQRDGRSVEYTPTNRRDLETYISRLETELSQNNYRRPFRVRV